MKARYPPARLRSRLAVVCCTFSIAAFSCDSPNLGAGMAGPGGWDPTDATPLVILTTALGAIEIEVFPDAAPDTVDRWLRLVKGAGLDTDSDAKPDAEQPDGYYDGLAFSFTQPHIEIVTAVHTPAAAGPQFEIELDAISLGLDKDVIEDYAEAMRVLQWELIRAHGKMGKGDKRPALLAEWVDRWHETDSVEFLIGESRQRINEAQGYVYRTGMKSRPVTAGAVALKPLSQTRASARLSIALADMPQRTGKWMVIGRVTKGLDVAERISVQTLKGQGTPLAKNFEPLDPVVIGRVVIRRQTLKEKTSPPGPEHSSDE